MSDLTGRVLVLLAVGSLLVPAAPSLAADPKAEGHAFQPLQVAATTIMQSALGPLTSIAISDDLNCAVNHAQDTDPEFYGGTACATLVAVGGTLYGPADIPAGSSASPRTTSTPVSQSAVTGTGSAADPFQITTEVQLGSSGLRLVETDSYVAGEEAYRTSIDVINDIPAPLNAIVYRGRSGLFDTRE